MARVLAAALAALCVSAGPAQAEPPGLWRFLTDLRMAAVRGAPYVEDLLPVRVEVASDSGDYYVMQAGPFDLNDQRVDYVSYRVPKLRPQRIKKLQLELDGDCVRLRALRRAYPDARLTDMPRGNAIHEQTYYASTDELGTIGFGFPEFRRYCLQTVTIVPVDRAAP